MTRTYWFEIKITKLSSNSYYFILLRPIPKHYSKHLLSKFFSSDQMIFLFTTKNPSRNNSQQPLPLRRIIKHRAFRRNLSPSPFSIERRIRVSQFQVIIESQEFLPRIKQGEGGGRKEGFFAGRGNSSGCETLNFRFITFSSQTR